MRYIISIIFLMPCAYAMDLAIVQKEENTFNLLPLELQGKIIKNILSLIIREHDDSDEHIDPQKFEQSFLCIPLSLGTRFTYKFHQLQKLCQTEIGNKAFVARELFALPCKQQDVFVRMANRSVLKYVAEGDLSLDDYQIIKIMDNENIKKGLTLRLLHGNKITSYMRAVGAVGIYLVFASLVCGIGLNIKNLYFEKLIIGSGLSCVGIFGVSILLEICGYGAEIEKVRF